MHCSGTRTGAPRNHTLSCTYALKMQHPARQDTRRTASGLLTVEVIVQRCVGGDVRDWDQARHQVSWMGSYIQSARTYLTGVKTIERMMLSRIKSATVRQKDPKSKSMVETRNKNFSNGFASVLYLVLRDPSIGWRWVQQYMTIIRGNRGNGVRMNP